MNSPHLPEARTPPPAWQTTPNLSSRAKRKRVLAPCAGKPRGLPAHAQSIRASRKITSSHFRTPKIFDATKTGKFACNIQGREEQLKWLADLTHAGGQRVMRDSFEARDRR